MVYKLHITQQHIDDGFAIGACSAQGSRFKLLLFQQCSDGDWGQLAQASALTLSLKDLLSRSFGAHLCITSQVSQDDVFALHSHKCHTNIANS